MTLALREPAIHPEGKVASQDNNSREARNTYSEGAAYFEGPSPLTATNGATLAAYLPFHILLPQNTRPGRRTDVRS